MFPRVTRRRWRASSRLAVVRLEDRAQPAILTVTSLADAGPGTLRDAVTLAQNGDEIQFALPAGPQTIALTSGELAFALNLTITGPGADLLTVSGSNLSRVFAIVDGNSAITRMTIADGFAPNFGGAIFNGNFLKLDGVVVRGSTAEDGTGAALGGGIYNTGILTATNSTIAFNAAGRGAGIYNETSSTLTLQNVTVSGNAGEGVKSHGTTRLSHVTIAGNADTGLETAGGLTQFDNTLLAGNPGGNVLDNDPSFPAISLGFNLSDDATGKLTGPGDRPNQPAKLLALGGYGSPVPTHGLAFGSRALDGGQSPLASDARGLPRGADGDGDGKGSFDIGAFEMQVHLVRNTNDAGPDSLRTAIQKNNAAGGGRIAFAIPGAGPHVIQPSFQAGGFALDPVNQPVVLDGRSQGGPGYTGAPLIIIDGTTAASGGAIAAGLEIAAAGSVVTGLAVGNFLTAGTFGIGVFAHATTLLGNTVGLDGAGTPRPNAGGGLRVTSDAVTLGSADPKDGNTIAFNNGDGVTVVGGAVVALGNSIYGNTGPGIRYAFSAPAVPQIFTADVASTTTVTGQADSFAGFSTVTLQFYANPPGTTQSEGKRFLAAATVPANEAFSVALPATSPGETITVTGTAPDNRTSEFSPPVAVLGPTVAFAVEPLFVGDATAGQGVQLRIRAIDSAGQTTPGYVGTTLLSSSDGQAIFAGAATLTAGIADVPVTFLTAGAQSFTATDDSTLIASGSATITVVAAAASTFAVAAPPVSSAGNTFTADVTALDPFGNVATAYAGTVTFGTTDKQATVPAPATLTNGVGTFTFTLRTAATQTITAADAGITGTADVTVFAAPASTYGVSVPASVVAGQTFTATVTAFDPFGNVADGQESPVALSTTDKQATVPPPAFLFGGVGQFDLVLRTAGNHTITATGGGISGQGTTNVVAATATKLTLAAPNAAVAGVAFKATVTAFDAFGNVATGYKATVNFTSTDAQATLPAAATLTAGKGTFAVTFRTAATQTLAVGDGKLSAAGFVNVATAAAASFTLAVPTTTPAGVGFSATVTALDAFGNVATSYGGSVAFTSSDAQATLPAPATLSNGVGTVSVTFRTAGNRTLTATDGPISRTATVAVTPGAAATFTVAAPAGAVAGTAFDATVTAFDTFGNVATGYAGTVAFTSTDGQATLPAVSTLVSGVGTFAVTFRTAAAQSLTAADGGLTGTAGVAVSPGAVAAFTVAAPSSAVAGTAFPATVTAFDAFGNIATNYAGTVTFTSTDAQATLPAPATLANGVGSFTVTFRTAGPATLTAADGGTAGTATFGIAHAAASRFVVAAPPNTEAGVGFTATITAFDAFGNVATSYAGTVGFAASDAQATLPPNATLVNGVGTAAATFRTAGAQTLTATDGTLTAAADVTVTAAAAVGFDVDVSTARAIVTAGNLVPVTVTARDAFGNVAAGYAGNVGFSGTDPQATLPGAAGLNGGVGTFLVTFRTAGDQTLNVADAADPTATGSADVTVNAAAAATLTVTGPTAAVVAGTPATFQLIARDAFGNVATGYAGTLTFTSTDAAATLPAPAGLVNGTGTVTATFRTAGTVTFAAADGPLAGSSAGVVVVAAAADRFRLDVPSTATAGTPVTAIVTALDPFGNVATSFADAVTFASSDPAATLPAAASLTNGVGSFPATFDTVGNQTLTAAGGSLSATATVTVAAVPVIGPTIAAIGAGVFVAGSAFTFTVTGSGFVPGAVVRLGGLTLTTRFVDATRLDADVTATTPAGLYAVTAANPDGGTSNVVPFGLAAPTLAGPPGRDLATPVEDADTRYSFGPFVSNNPRLTAADLVADIDWGDGTASAGTVVADGAGGFVVRGNHIYADALPRLVTVTIRDRAGAGVTVQRVAVVVTAEQFAVLGETAADVTASGGTVAVPGVAATLTEDDGDEVIVRVSRYLDDPGGRLDGEAAAYDVQVLGADAGDRVAVRFTYTPVPGGVPNLLYYDEAAGEYRPATGVGPILIDPVAGTIDIVFGPDSVPAITNLLGTVFVITVTAAPPPTVPVVVPLASRVDFAAAGVGFDNTGAGVGAGRLLAASVLGFGTAFGAADAAELFIPAGVLGGGEDNPEPGPALPFLPADEAALTVRPSADEVLPTDGAAKAGDPLPGVREVTGPFAPALPSADGAYRGGDARPGLRVYPDRAATRPAPLAAPTTVPPAPPPANEVDEADEFAALDDEFGSDFSIAVDPPTNEVLADPTWRWVAAGMVIAVGVRAVIRDDETDRVAVTA